MDKVVLLKAPPFDPPDGYKVIEILVCKRCESPEITYYAAVYTNLDTGEDEIADYLDDFFCHNCEKDIKETFLMYRIVPDA